MGETHYTACVRYDQSWLSVTTSHLLLFPKCNPPIAADTDYILFYVLTSGPANSFGASALLSPSRISVGVGSVSMSCETSTDEQHLGFSWSRPHIEHLSVAPLAGPPQTRTQT